MTELIDKKIKALDKRLKNLNTKEYCEIESIHKIRTSAREILSLLANQNLHCEDLKKILKLSNKIRDIDVFLSEYLIKVPDEYYAKINICLLKDILKDEREKEILLFKNYLKNFLVDHITYLPLVKKEKNLEKKPILVLKKKRLHKFRIYIKKELYITKNNNPSNMEKIQLLKDIKDILGYINDNFNAIRTIEKLIEDKENIKELRKFTKTENKNYLVQINKLLIRLENNH